MAVSILGLLQAPAAGEVAAGEGEVAAGEEWQGEEWQQRAAFQANNEDKSDPEVER